MLYLLLLKVFSSVEKHHIPPNSFYSISTNVCVNCTPISYYRSVCCCRLSGFQFTKNTVPTNHKQMGVFFSFSCCVLSSCWICVNFSHLFLPLPSTGLIMSYIKRSLFIQISRSLLINGSFLAQQLFSLLLTAGEAVGVGVAVCSPLQTKKSCLCEKVMFILTTTTLFILYIKCHIQSTYAWKLPPRWEVIKSVCSERHGGPSCQAVGSPTSSAVI